MSRCKSSTRMVRRSNLPFSRQLVGGPKGRRLLNRSCLVAVFCGVVFALVAFAGFITAPTYDAGPGPTSAVVADFNGDGIPDLVVVNRSGNSRVSILLGKPDGTFQAPRSYAGGFEAVSVAVGDFNGDGKLDLAVANDRSGHDPAVKVLLGNGDGTFQAAHSYAAGSNPRSVAVGDFNGDGIPDLAVTDDTAPNPGTVIILLGNGDGTFRETAQGNAVGVGPVFVAAVDLNGDNSLDLVVVNRGPYPTYEGSVSILLGKGDGSFQAAQNYGVGKGPVSVAVADFNNDGRLDLAVANSGTYYDYNDGNLSVLLGNGDGTFQAALNYDVGHQPTSVAAADFNGDQVPDLALTTSSGVAVLLGKGDGTFQPAHTYPASSDPSSVAVGDFNRDGTADLAVTNSAYPGTVSIFFGKGDGTFLAARTSAAALGPASMAKEDFNGDGVLDLAVTDGSSDTVNILLGNGDGTFQPTQSYAVGHVPSAVAVGDFNGDGISDLAVANLRSGTVSILLGNGDGTFQAARSYPAGESPVFLAVGDFNGDGVPDLAVAEYDAVSILLGNGDGTFGCARSFDSEHRIVSLTAADLNRDGKDDIVTTTYVFQARPPSFSAYARVFLSNGDGTFREGKKYSVGPDPNAAVAVDLNGDGILDLAVTHNGDPHDRLVVFLGNGDGTFRRAINYQLRGYVPASMAVGDFNNDGIPDLAVSDWAGVNILLGNGDGTFRAAQRYAAGSYPRSLVMGDFNGDGCPDLAVLNGYSRRVTVLLNDGLWTP